MPVLEIMVLIAYESSHSLNKCAHARLSGGCSGLNLGLSHHIRCVCELYG